MSDAERRGTENPPRYPVVNQHGKIKMVMVAPGISGALYAASDGRIKVSDEHEAAGWVLLERLYQDEGRTDLWQVYLSYSKARAEGMEVEAFPEDYLPEEVKRRRAGHTPGRRKWTPPILAQPLISAEEKKGPGRPRKESNA